MQKKNLRFLATFILLIAVVIPVNTLSTTAQTTTYTNMQDSGSKSLPSGVTPDVSVDTISHLSINPNPAGVGQAVTIMAWLSPPLHASRYFNDFQIVITAPDGTTKTHTLKSYYADATAWLSFTPDQTGNYTIEFNFPGGYFPAGNYTVPVGSFLGAGVVSLDQSIYYKPSKDGPYTLTVTTEPAASYPSSPLPTEYWTRPINSANREWWSIAGWYPATGIVGERGNNWPEDTNTYATNYNYIPYTQAPESSHILWRRQAYIGGIYGGSAGAITVSTGIPNTNGQPTIIYSGRCYTTITKSVNGVAKNYWECYDLRTGEIYWQIPDVPAAQWVIYESGFGAQEGAGAQYGRAIYLATISNGRLIKYDPYTGAVSQNISIAPITSGTLYANTDWAYFYSVQTLGSGASAKYRLLNWTVHGDIGASSRQENISLRIISNITWPFNTLGTVDYESGIACNVVAQQNAGLGAGIDANITAVSLDTGQVLWSKMANVPYSVWPSETIADHGKLAVRFEDGLFYCWDLKSGQQLWKSDVSSWPWGVFGAYGISSYGGNIIVGQYDGVAAYDWATGKVSWLYQYKAQYPTETFYDGNYAFFSGSPLIADGKVYIINSEHTPTQPFTRGWALHCINATTGHGIWNLSMGAIMSNPVAVSDGYIVATNTYDGYTYIIGKGPSATTVTAPDKAINLGDSILIKGTVTDISPGTKQNEQAVRFPNGVPVVSDESMSAWMEYVYMQQPCPTNVVGVTVELSVVDANGNYRTIGTTTTDADGFFSFNWTPDIEGKYTLYANFKGSKSYWPSHAVTAFNVDPAPATPSPQPTQEPSTAELYFIPAVAGLFVAIIVVGLLTIMMAKKRP